VQTINSAHLSNNGNEKTSDQNRVLQCLNEVVLLKSRSTLRTGLDNGLISGKGLLEIKKI